MANPNYANRIFLSVVAGVAGLYIYDVQFNQGRNVDALGLYNWNAAPRVEASAHGALNLVSSSGSSAISSADDLRQSKYSKLADTSKDSSGGAKDQAEAAYAEAYKKVIAAQEQLAEDAESGKQGLLKWGKSKQDAAKAQLDEAQSQLDSAKSSLEKHGSNALKQAESKYGSFSDALKSNYAKMTDSAAQLAGYGSKAVANSRKSAEDAYAFAQAQLAVAQQKADESKQGLISWGNERHSEDEKVLKSAQKQVEDTQKELEQYGKDAVKEAKKRYDDRVKAITISFGKSKEDAIEAYNRFAAEAEDAQRVVQAYGTAASDEAQRRAANAQEALALASKNLRTFGADAYQQATESYNSLSQDAKKQYAEDADKAQAQWEEAANAIKGAWDDVKGGVGAAGNRVADAAKGAAVAAGQVAGSAKSAAYAAKGSAENAVDSAADSIGSAAEYARNSIGAATDSVVILAADAYSSALDNLEIAQEKVEEGKQGLYSWTAEQKAAADKQLEEAKEQSNIAKNALAEYSVDSLKEVQRKYDQSVEAVRATFGSTKESAVEAFKEFSAQVEAAQKKVQDYGSSATEQAEKNINNAQYNLALARKNLQHFGKDSVQEAQSQYEDLSQKAREDYAAAADKLQAKYDEVSQGAQRQANQFAGGIRNSYASAKKAAEDSYDAAQTQLRSAQRSFDESKESVSGWTDKQKKEAAANLKAAKDSVGSAQRQLFDFGADAVKQAQEKYESRLAAVRSSFGSTKSAAESSYEKALQDLDAAHKKADEYGRSWLGWGKSKNAEAEKQLEDAKDRADLAKENVQQFGEDAVIEAQKRFQSLKSSANSAAEAAKSSAGDAAQYVKDSATSAANAVKDSADSAAGAVKDGTAYAAQVAKDQYSSLFGKDGELQVKSREAAQQVIDYYNSQVAQAKKDYDDTQSSWGRWKDEKAKQAHDDADIRYQYLLKRQAEAQKKLDEFVEYGSGKVYDATEKQKQQLSKANEEAQGLLSRLQSWLRG
ncbi:DEKNAAC103539 [Brettanomyces naardenensis]|uniref:DEKNAAC103539 n=1 Tax=Brettanomyces naardenensis TaxID=13370 RepID=A0A448YNK0_BRENA|nr:DEKNAAC103539 [Brettanomyces naardenensis]